MSGLDAGWPTAVDYVGAAQDPEHCFVDARLKQAEFRTNRMGMPVIRSGQMAAVLPVEIAGHSYALRLFTTPVDHGERYRSIDAHLGARDDVPLVPAEWIDRAVVVGDGEYPAVLMSWVEGMLLSSYVDELVDTGRHTELRTLAAQWEYLVGRLRAASVVHGDLQHGNVMVGADGGLRLIDYDGLWVPGMSTDLREAGMPNYQHPQRMEVPNVLIEADTFAAFVIYVSLLAIAADPELWDRYHSGENLILVREDYLEVGRRETPVWNDLSASADPNVVRHADTLARLCSTDLRTIPTLHDLVNGGAGALSVGGGYVPERAGGRSGGNWWDDGDEHGEATEENGAGAPDGVADLPMVSVLPLMFGASLAPTSSSQSPADPQLPSDAEDAKLRVVAYVLLGLAAIAVITAIVLAASR